MKDQTTPSKTGADRGYATIAVVAALSLILISMMTYALIGNVKSLGSQVGAQMKQDHSQKEDAILTALLHIVPNKAIGAMQQGSAANADDYTWESIFGEALTVANAEQAVSASLLSALSLDDAIAGNSGDTSVSQILDVVAAPVETDAGDENIVNGGNWWEYYMLFENTTGPHLPAPLMLSNADYQLDKKYPLISFTKKHVYNYHQYNSLYYKGVNLSTDLYPLYNQIEYPDIKFGYRRPGDLFVAKRNWWVFSLTFGKAEAAQTGVAPVSKTYVLSIYEVPSQLPLSASSFMKVGQHADGSDWQNVTLDGGIYADAVETGGTVALAQGAISARKSLSVGGTTTVGGRSVASNFDDIGKREERALSSDSDFYDASLSGNVGKVAFIPINPGFEFLKRSLDGPQADRISPTGWKTYSRGANQAAMRLDVHEMTDVSTQIPTRIRFYYKDTYGATQSVEYERGVNWPTKTQSGGATFPFQTDVLDNGRNALVVRLDLLPGHLAGITNAAGLDVNHSIYISPVNSEPTVQAPSFPSVATDMSVTLRGGKNMSSYTKGFSVITDVRLYIGESLNGTAVTAPAGSGIAATEEYYPPISLFAPEKRFGESLTYTVPVSLRGQLSTLKNSTGDTFNPMELIGADDQRLDSDKMVADLVTLRSPAELPPVHLMNWMVTIEEIH